MDSDKSEQNVGRRTEWGFHFSHLFIKWTYFAKEMNVAQKWRIHAGLGDPGMMRGIICNILIKYQETVTII